MDRNIFYEKKLYPLQDVVLASVNERTDVFYLTGGTALSRFYLGHRYSDDLDFFTRQEIGDFSVLVNRLAGALNTLGLTYEAETVTGTFSRIYVMRDDVKLQVDFVNEPVFHYGDISNVQGVRVDNVLNILANKISAIERYEVKDLADIHAIACKYAFDWKHVVDIASKKALIDPITVSRIIEEMPAEELNIVKWVCPPDVHKICTGLHTIARDILTGNTNTLYRK